ncbi:amidohydrolase family protein [Novosphingobium sp.]|uniref:N-acyl-D-amino-acid deacylase family protein n=1 Tax=Novosphingobium sp. TaxID=1874826 RepID=UPI0035AE35A0
MARQLDCVIRGGTVADGTGAALREADIAIAAGKIVAVGKVPDRGAEEIDARGQIVTPGFVDVHTHYDGQATWDSRMQPSSWHGVTTAVMGNCGVGFAPVKPQDRDRLVELMEGVEDIPGTALHEGLAWNWQSFPEYLDALDARPRDMDICAQLPHGALRVFVMGERGANLEAATEDDIAQMRRLSAEAVAAGAIGFSTSRTLNHRTVKGDPTPSLRATEAELMGIALGQKDAGKGVLELISDFNQPDVETEFAMVRRIVAASGRPLSLSLGQAHSKPDGWRDLLGMIDRANEDGLEIKAQVAPRPIGLLLGLQASASPFSHLPSYQKISALPFDQRLAAMRDPSFRAQLLLEADGGGAGETNQVLTATRMLTNYGMIFPLGDPPNYEPGEETSLANQARREGRSANEVAYDLMIANDGRDFMLLPFANYAHFNLDDTGEMLGAKNTLMGLGDGGAHVGLISDGSFPTYLLSHWGRDRAHGRIDLATLVKRQTSDNARAMGLLDRGVIAPGMRADINVIDFARLGCQRPEMAYDLPAGGKRLLQRATGYTHTMVAGQVTYRDGAPTGALPGRLVRGSQPAPAAA